MLNQFFQMTPSYDIAIYGGLHALNAFKDLALFLFFSLLLENMIDSVLYTCRMSSTWCQVYPIQNKKFKGHFFFCDSQNYADVEIKNPKTTRQKLFKGNILMLFSLFHSQITDL